MELRKIIAMGLTICVLAAGVGSTGIVTNAAEVKNEQTQESIQTQEDGREQEDMPEQEGAQNSEDMQDQNQVTEEEAASGEADMNEDEAKTNEISEQTDETERQAVEQDKEFRGNSWRYSDGQLIQTEKSRARASYANAWNKVNGRYVNNKGEVIPGAQKKGIDVSEWQEKIDWNKVKAAGIDYAILRCGWGTLSGGRADYYWQRNVSECERLGIPYGVYLYSYADSVAEASSEADHVLELLKGHNPSYPVYFDMEDQSTVGVGNAMLGKMAKTFCDKISAAGYRTGVYANLNWWNNYLTSDIFNNPSWSKWVAQYNSQCDYKGAYDMWQCTDSGTVNGVNGPTDLNFWMVKTDDVSPVEVEDSEILSYSSHLETFGWQSEVQNGAQSGVTGYAKRLEAFKIKAGDGYGDLGVKYSAHVQGYGWQDYVSDGQVAGTSGEGKRIEAVKIELTGTEAAKYDVYYRVHAQSYGWLGWTKNGIPAGTQGYGKRIEAMQIAVLPKGSDVLEEADGAFHTKPMSVEYQSYVADNGWQGIKENGGTAGTTGLSKSLEAVKVTVSNQQYDGGVTYDAYMQGYGWTGAKSNMEAAGKAGSGKRLEAVKIELTGELAKYYDIYYRAYVQSYGWLDWASNGQEAGTFDYAKRMEALEIKLVEKGGAAPGKTDNTYKKAGIKYNTHVQTFGWKGEKFDGETGGTEGLAKRMEAVTISLADSKYAKNLRYKTHVQTYGWQNWVSGGQQAGTTGLAKRLEAIQVELTGEAAQKYDVYYRVHAQTYGWLDWAKNGAPAGTEGLAKRLEAVQIKLVEKGASAPGDTKNCFVKQ